MSETNRKDIITVDLTKPLRRETCGVLLAVGDEYANRFGAVLVNKGAAVNVSGYTVTGAFIRPDGATVTVNGGVDGGIVYVDLPSSCYIADGPFSLSLKVVGDGFTQTVRIVDGFIRRTATESFVADDETIFTIDQMKGLADNMAATNEEAKELIADLNEVSAEADKAIEEANNVVDKLPYIGDNGNWYKWDDEAGEFVDSGSPSRGDKGDKGDTGSKGDTGTSVTVQSVSESTADGGYSVVTFSDGTSVRIKNGSTGKDGTGVTILGSYDSESALTAAHPTGNAGDAYLIDGYLYVWSASANAWQNVGQIQGPQGAAGSDGKDGVDGYTPVKGTDYWTASDKQSIVNDVLAALPTAEGVSF